MNNKSKAIVLSVIVLVWVILISLILSRVVVAEEIYHQQIKVDDFVPPLSDSTSITDQFIEATEDYNSDKKSEYENRSVTTLPGIEYSGTKFYQDEDAVTIAKLLYGECRGIPNREEKEAVVWVVLNRVDNNRFPNTVYEVVTAKGQFEGYDVNHPVWEELLEISNSVLSEWNKEQNGEISNRSLPSDYFFFHGDGVHNWFRKEFRDKTYYDFGG